MTTVSLSASQMRIIAEHVGDDQQFQIKNTILGRIECTYRANLTDGFTLAQYTHICCLTISRSGTSLGVTTEPLIAF